MPHRPYKISLTEAQKATLERIGNGTVILFDKTNTVKINKTLEPIDLKIFDALDMLGILQYNRKIGKDQYLYKINKNYTAKIK